MALELLLSGVKTLFLPPTTRIYSVRKTREGKVLIISSHEITYPSTNPKVLGAPGKYIRDDFLKKFYFYGHKWLSLPLTPEKNAEREPGGY